MAPHSRSPATSGGSGVGAITMKQRVIAFIGMVPTRSGSAE